MSQQLQNGKQQYINGSGQPLANGSVGIYTPGTLNPINTWQDQGLTTLNANPVVLDGSGMASIWGVDGNLYRQIVKDSLGNLVWDEVVGYDPSEYLSLSIAGGTNITLTATQAANRIINLTGAITANVNLIVPQSSGLWTFQNNTTGAYTVTVTTGSGTSVSIPQGTSATLASDGINVFDADSSKIKNLQNAVYITANDTGTANAYVMALSPPITAYSAGMMLNLAGIVATNTGASTIAVNGLAALPIQGPAGVALQGGELVATYGAILRINKAANAAELVYSSGGPNQVAAASKSGHEVNLGQLANGTTNIGNREIFTSSGTFTVPSNVTTIWVSGVAGGGGGGGAGGTVGSSGYAGGGGGGGGGAGQFTLKQSFTVAPGNSVAITIGAAGASGAGGASTGAAGAAGGAGGNTTVVNSTTSTTLLTLTGGSGGANGGGQASTTGGIPTGGGGGAGGAGYPNGSYGTDGNYAGNGGTGASSPFGGGGGAGRAAGGAGLSGSSPGNFGGGGGGGGGAYSTAAAAGGNGAEGASGVVILEW